MELERQLDSAAGENAVAIDTTERLRLIVIDPDPLARQAIVDALRADGRYVIAAQTGDAVEGKELVLHYRPDLAVIAAAIPGSEPVQMVEKIAAAAPEVRTVMLAAERTLEVELRAMRAGASGFIEKSAGLEAIADALETIAAGAPVISSELTNHLLGRLRRMPDQGTGTRPVKSALTSREWEVLDQICDGASTREVADALFLTQDTVNSHIKSIFRKLGVHSRGAAAAVAAQLRGEVVA
jgi:DNA-binding NarL/FixJ family response regulator